MALLRAGRSMPGSLPNGRRRGQLPHAENMLDMTIAELIARYWPFVQTYYRLP
jgi:hypothetical protein